MTTDGTKREPEFWRWQESRWHDESMDPTAAEVISAGGLHVYPGLVSTDTTLGLIETSAIDVTRDYTEFGDITVKILMKSAR